MTCSITEASQADDDGLVLMFNDIEPYIIVRDGEITGFIARYLNDVLKAAKVTPIWENVPWERQLPTLQRNLPNICAVAIYRTPERSSFALYTAVIGVDFGYALVGPIRHDKLLEHKRFKDVVDDPSLVPILQEHSVYSDYINETIADKNFTVSSGSMLRLVRRLLAEEHDYVIMPDYMTEGFLDVHSLSGKLQTYNHYTDLSDPSPYYLACSKSTNPDTFARVNTEILRRGPSIPD